MFLDFDETCQRFYVVTEEMHFLIFKLTDKIYIKMYMKSSIYIYKYIYLKCKFSKFYQKKAC